MVSIGFRLIPVDSGEFPLGRLRWLPVIIFDGVLVALLTPTKGALKPLQNDKDAKADKDDKDDKDKDGKDGKDDDDNDDKDDKEKWGMWMGNGKGEVEAKGEVGGKGNN